MKLLIAVKAGRALNYSRWESEASPRFNLATAFRGREDKLYDPIVPGGHGPIHVSGPNDRIQAVRDTWWKDTKNVPDLDAKFFFGTSDVPALGDEVNLPVSDIYADLPLKTKEILRYSMGHGYDYSFLCDDDTFVFVDRLIKEAKAFTEDYGGCAMGNVCTGGPGYLISRRAVGLCLNNWHSGLWCEDVTVGKSCFFNGIGATLLPNHRSGRSNHHFFVNDKFDPTLLDDQIVSMHAVFPDCMRACYKYIKGL